MIRAAAVVAILGAFPPAPTTTAPQPGEVVCTVDDPRAIELSGLVATADGYVSVIDSQWDEDQVVIVYLDNACRVTRIQRYPTPARDPEDIAIAPDGTLWSADIGDNATAAGHRQTIALWRIPSDGGSPVIYRMTYPDGPHDAESLLFDAAGNPVIVTKELSGSKIYRASQPLQPNTAQGVPLTKVGEFHPVATGDPNDLGRIGELLVTGAATSPDRKRIALRTYTAAYEWDVVDNDIIKTMTTRTPRITPLPDEPQGESITYSLDGTHFITCSDESGPTQLRRYVPSTELVKTAAKPTSSTLDNAGGAADQSSPMLWYGLALAGGGMVVLLGGLGFLIARRRGGAVP